ncbi:MAG: hypothetical protein MJK18_07520 [Bdellovibrionales bacterium]|nr:hypothetical protein [Bdellovibrionales bacterium]
MTINELIKRAFEEDIPSIDKTTEALKKKEAFGVAQLIAKQDLTLSGCDFFEQSLHHRDPNLNINWNFKDGDSVINQQIIAQIDGNL